MKKLLLLMVLCAFASASCNSRQKQAQAANTDITTDNPKVEKAKEDIVGHIKDLYAIIAQKKEGNTERFACHTWWNMVAEVEKKDADIEEIGFFNDDLWTQMTIPMILRFATSSSCSWTLKKARLWLISFSGVPFRPFTRSSSSAVRMVTGVYTIS